MTGAVRVLPAMAAVLAVGGATVSAVLAVIGDDGASAEIVIAVVIAVYAGVGLLIAGARPRHPVGRLLLAGAAIWGLGEGVLAVAVHWLVTEPGSVPAAAWLAVLGTLLRGAGWLVLVLVVPLVFPDGRPPPRPWQWAAPMTASAVVAFAVVTLLAPAPIDDRLAEVANPLAVPASLAGAADGLAVVALLLAAAAVVGAVGGLVGRWRSGGPLLRQQLLWFSVAAVVPVPVLLLIIVADVGPVFFGVSVLGLPIAMGVAVLQHRLYDVPFVVNRTVAWGMLTVTLALVYVLVVAGVGALLDARGASWLPWVATGLVALSVAPLRDALQGAANRLTYGLWAQPETVLAAVRRRVADAGDAHALLRELVTELGEGLELAGIAVVDADGSVLASHGAASDTDEVFALTAYGRPVGVLRFSRPPRQLRARDYLLLEDLAGQVGALVHAAGLVSGLRAAQERLVLAREGERRRLRRELHDGLGSRLAGLTFLAEAAGNRLRTDPDGAEESLRHIASGIQAAVVDVRHIVDGLTPSSLDQLGLAGAVAELAERLGSELPGGIVVDAPPELPQLTAAVEVAAYRVAQEAMTNVVRHAGATTCRIAVRHDGCALLLEVEDDGSGEVAPRPGAAGLPGMHERAEELSGELRVECRRGRGTSVRLRLPTTGPAPQPAVVAAGAVP